MLRSLLNKPRLTVCARIPTEIFELRYRCSRTLHPNLSVLRLAQRSFNTKEEESVSDSKSEPFVVYQGAYCSKVFRVKGLSLCSSIMGVCAQPIIMQKLESMGQLILANIFIGFFTFVTPVLLHLVTRKYVTKVLYDPTNDTYTASFYTFYLTERQFSFGPGEAEVPDIPAMFTTFKIRGVSMLVDVHDFDVTHYARILGYDKPLSYKLPKEDEETAPDVNEAKENKKE